MHPIPPSLADPHGSPNFPIPFIQLRNDCWGSRRLGLKWSLWFSSAEKPSPVAAGDSSCCG
jgi:hypothetical protein